MSNLPRILEGIGVDRGDAARGIGISRQTLWRMATGKLEPTRPVILRTLSFLNAPENLKRLGRRKPLSFEEVFGGRAA
jgi:DNA-binding XRE family transcriptional regulator